MVPHSSERPKTEQCLVMQCMQGGTEVTRADSSNIRSHCGVMPPHVQHVHAKQS
jgi:hypothetical protein